MNNKYKILVVEDEINIRNLLVALLETNGYAAIVAGDYTTGKMMYESHRPDLVILDLGLPDIDGTTFINEVRKVSLTPIIVLSARTDESDKVGALDMGANDYVTKPFGLRELMARIEANLRREKRSQYINEENKRSTLYFGKLCLYMKERAIKIDGKNIDLTKIEYDIVELLALHAGQVFSREQIYEKVWGCDSEGDSSTVVERVKKIRAKFSAVTPEKEYISTVWGIGYKWNKM